MGGLGTGQTGEACVPLLCGSSVGVSSRGSHWRLELSHPP